MKKAKLTIKKMTTLTYSTKYKNRDFYVDIVEFGVNEHEAWIYTSEYGIKSLMFGNHYSSFDSFFELVVSNFNEYADDYLKSMF